MQLEELNDSELWEIARTTLSGAWCRPIRLKRSVARERVIYLIESGQKPESTEEYIDPKGMDSRSKLEVWVKKNWSGINSQLPCTGPLRGQCTQYPCPEGRHMRCYADAKPYLDL
jgi:hypothetical protein